MRRKEEDLRGIDRRENSEGRETWTVRYYDYSGRKRRERFDRLDQAIERRDEVRRLKMERKPLQSQKVATLREFARDTWTPHQKQVNHRRTCKRHFSIFKNYIRTYDIAKMRIDEVRTEDVENWLSELRLEHDDEELASIAMARIVLSSIFTLATRFDRSTRVKVNPVRNSSGIPKRLLDEKKKKADAWDILVCERIHWTLRNESRRQTEWQAAQDSLFFSFQLLAGLRPGEVMALTWNDVSGENISVERAVSEGGIKETKTGVKRYVPIVPPLREEINEFREMVSGELRDFIIRKEDGGHWTTSTFKNFSNRDLKRAFARVEAEWPDFREALEAEGVPCVPETAEGLAGSRSYETGRHTHSALLLNSFLSITRMAEIQGHSTQVLHADYSKALATRPTRRDHVEVMTEVRRDVDRVSQRLQPRS